jgi:hypothetical protein
MKKIIIILLAAVLPVVWSCSPFNEAHTTDVKELAFNLKELKTVSADGGEISIPVYSSGQVNISFVGSADWAQLSTGAIDGDATLTVNLDKNLGMRRMVKVAMALNGTELKDTICIKQEGVQAFLECPAPYLAVLGGDTDKITFILNTNIDSDLVQKTVEYISGGKDWMSEFILKDQSKTTSILETTPTVNTGAEARKARVSLTHIDGWEESYRCDLYITQSKQDGSFGTPIDFAQARALGSTEGAKISEDLLINGIIVSDHRSRNMDENTNVTYAVVDSLYSLTTAYLMSEDGTYGFRLKFNTASDNGLIQGTRLQLNLNGTVLTKEENPERYTIHNVDGTNMVGSSAGTMDDVPVKTRTIASLTDSDIYTFVSLQNTEFIFKYGTFADVYENYTLKSELTKDNPNNNGRMDGWATLLVDADGNSIYAPVNMLCLWRRAAVPQGAGATNGIIVHNKLPKVGNVGKYQIRVLDRSGFAQAETGSAYEEYCIWNGEGTYKHSLYSKRNTRYNHNSSNSTEATKSIIPSSDILDYPELSETYTTPAVPKGELFLENRVSSNGVWPHNNGEYYCRPSLIGEEVAVTSDFKVQPIQGESEQYTAYNARVNVSGWYNFDNSGNLLYNADGSVNSNGIRYELSTKNLSGSGMLFSFDFAAGNISASYSKTFPAHWCVEYSVDGGETYTILNDYISGKPYIHLRSLPWWDATVNGALYKTCSAAGLGFSQHAYLLPADVLGKDMLKVRLRPYDAKITTLPIVWNGDNETAEIQKSTAAANQIRIGSAKFSVKK